MFFIFYFFCFVFSGEQNEKSKRETKTRACREKVTGVKKKITRHMTADERVAEELRKRRRERDA